MRRPSLETLFLLIVVISVLGTAAAMAAVFVLVPGVLQMPADAQAGVVDLRQRALAVLTGLLTLGGVLLAVWLPMRGVIMRRLQQEIEARAQQLASKESAVSAQLREAAALEERNRLARDLHDTIKQQLFSINVAAATAQSLQAHDPAGAAQHVQRVRDLSQAALVEMKALLAQLRPRLLATAGLIGAIREQLDALHFRAEVETELCHDLLPDEAEMPPGAQEAIFRTVQEALSNIARHARARRVCVSLARETADGRNRLRVSVQDDGQGFDQSTRQPGMGLSNMRARITELGGQLEVRSTPGQGTTIIFDVPLVSPQQQRERAQLEKEERFQQVYWANSLSALAAVTCAVLGIGIAGMMTGFDAGEQAQRIVLTLAFAGGAGLSLPLVLASISYRRRVRAFGPPGSVWNDLLRGYDLQQVGLLALLGAWVCFSLRWFIPAGLLMLTVIVLAVVIVRSYRELERRLDEWATQRLLRSRRNEQLLFLAIGVVFAGFVYAGLYGDLRQVSAFHEAIDQRWFLTFMAVVYPVIVALSVPGAVWFHRMLERLRAIEGEVLPAASRAMTTDVSRLRLAASALTTAHIACIGLAGVSLTLTPFLFAAFGIAAGIALVVKWRIERVLTARVSEWSDPEAQRSALWVYTILLFVVSSGLVGGMFGAVLALVAPGSSGEAVSSPIVAGPLQFALVIAAMSIGTPPYLLLQIAATRRRIKHLQPGKPGLTN